MGADCLKVVAKIVDGLASNKIIGYRFKSMYHGNYINYRMEDAKKVLSRKEPDNKNFLPNMYYYDDIIDEIEYLSITDRENEISGDTVRRVLDATGIDYAIYNMSNVGKYGMHTIKRLVGAYNNGGDVIDCIEDILYEVGMDNILFRKDKYLGIDYDLMRGFNRLKWLIGIDYRNKKCYISDSLGSKIETGIKRIYVTDSYTIPAIVMDNITLIKDRLTDGDDIVIDENGNRYY